MKRIYHLLFLLVPSIYGMEEGISKKPKIDFSSEENQILLTLQPTTCGGSLVSLAEGAPKISFDEAQMQAFHDIIYNPKQEAIYAFLKSISVGGGTELTKQLFDNYTYKFWSENYIFPFSECLGEDCYLSRKDYDTRKDIEQNLIQHSSHLKNKKITIAGFGSGKLFELVSVLYKLQQNNNIKAGNCIIIDPVYKSLISDTNVQHRFQPETYNSDNKFDHYKDSLWKYRIFVFLSIFRQLYNKNLPVYIYDDVAKYVNECKQNSSMRPDISFACDYTITDKDDVGMVASLFNLSKPDGLCVSGKDYVHEDEWDVMLPQVYSTVLKRNNVKEQDTVEGVKSLLMQLNNPDQNMQAQREGWQVLWKDCEILEEVKKTSKDQKTAHSESDENF